MKNRIVLCLGLALTLMAAGCIMYMPESGYTVSPDSGRTAPYDEPGQNDRDESYFYDYLSPYGNWIEHPSYGYVWMPRAVSYGWRPYTIGRWATTDYGWTWVSSENWGWAVYHYGRWSWSNRLGWFWVPDTVWAPAWVAWRWDDLYFGWAPLPPGHGFGNGRMDMPNEHWVFVPGGHFMDRGIDRWVLPRERNRTIIGLTSFKSNIHNDNGRVINDGPPSERVRKLTGRPMNRYSLKESSRPGREMMSDGQVEIYKPNLRENKSARPGSFIKEKDLESEDGGRVIKKSVYAPTSDMSKVQAKEWKLLEESQKTEIKQISKKIETEKAQAGTESDRVRINEKLNTRVAELKKEHEREKTELSSRQKQESGKKVIRKEPEKVKVPEKKPAGDVRK